MVRRQPYCSIPRRTEYRALCWGLHAYETDFRSKYVGWSYSGRYSSVDGLGGRSGTKCYRKWRMERTPIQ